MRGSRFFGFLAWIGTECREKGSSPTMIFRHSKRTLGRPLVYRRFGHSMSNLADVCMFQHIHFADQIDWTCTKDWICRTIRYNFAPSRLHQWEDSHIAGSSRRRSQNFQNRENYFYFSIAFRRCRLHCTTPLFRIPGRFVCALSRQTKCNDLLAFNKYMYLLPVVVSIFISTMLSIDGTRKKDMFYMGSAILQKCSD